MEDPRTTDGIEHLQRAAKELVAAARSFLEVVEEVVDDEQRFAEAASTVANLVRDGVEQVGSLGGDPEWWRDAWTERRNVDGEAGATDDHTPRNGAGSEWRVPDEDEVGGPARSRVRRVRRVALDGDGTNP